MKQLSINPSITSYIYLTLSQLMVGINIVGSKYLIKKMPIFILLETRFAFATIILIFLAKLMVVTPTKNVHLSKQDWSIIILQALCAGFLFNFLMLSGLHYTSANVAGIITSTLPLVISLLSFLFLREYLSITKWLCIVVATFGLIIINLTKMDTGNYQNTLVGDLLIFLALLPEAIYYLLAKKYGNQLPVLTISGWMNGINALVFIPFALFSIHNNFLANLTLYDWSLALLIGLASALFYVFWYKGSAKVPLSIAALFTAVMPIGTLIIAWIFLNERLTWLQFIGMFLVLSAVILSARIKE